MTCIYAPAWLVVDVVPLGIVHESWATQVSCGNQHSRMTWNQGSSLYSFILWGLFARTRLLSVSSSVINSVTIHLAFVAVNVVALVCEKNSSHTPQHEDLRTILIWSETHFSAWYDQPALLPTLVHTLWGKALWKEKSCYLYPRGEVWSAYIWSGTSFTAVEALIEEIRGDGLIGAGWVLLWHSVSWINRSGPISDRIWGCSVHCSRLQIFCMIF